MNYNYLLTVASTSDQSNLAMATSYVAPSGENRLCQNNWNISPTSLPCHRGDWDPPPKTMHLWLPGAPAPNERSIHSAVFAQLSRVINRNTPRYGNVDHNSPHLMRTTWPTNSSPRDGIASTINNETPITAQYIRLCGTLDWLRQQGTLY